MTDGITIKSLRVDKIERLPVARLVGGEARKPTTRDIIFPYNVPPLVKCFACVATMTRESRDLFAIAKHPLRTLKGSFNFTPSFAEISFSLRQNAELTERSG